MIERMSVHEKLQGDSRVPAGQPQVGTAAVNVCLLGASFDTGNLGVSALAESSVKCILAKWPDACITLFGSGLEEGTHSLRLEGKTVVLRNVPVRFCKNVFLSAHYAVLFFYVLIVRLLPFAWIKRRLASHSSVFQVLLEADLFVDIAGGDSFSDIYGMRRLTLGFLRRLLPFMLKKDVVMFPQTYGPFSGVMSRCMARFIVKRAKRIYARDHAGLDYLKELMGSTALGDKARFAPDVAFVLDPKVPEKLDIDGLETVRSSESVVVGLNVSGLIYYGGYTGGNEFGLNVDYKELIDRTVELVLARPGTLLLLVPHVVPLGSQGGNVENDLCACLDVCERFSGKYRDRLFVARSRYDQAEIKHIIGTCDFFIGTRMHSCIAALSQSIPAVGLAYSKKFAGVFETASVGELVVDMRSATLDEAAAAMGEAFASRLALAQRLREVIPGVKKQVQALLQDMDSCARN